MTLLDERTSRGVRSPRRGKAARVMALLLLLGVVVTAWAQLGPVALGGRTSYVLTNGTSMLPHFRTGGLVITRSEPSYHVGEVVAYHNRQLHEVVMHRIVAIDGDRYVFKGDNNLTADLYHPVRSDLVGKEWVYLAGGGRYFLTLRQPIVFAVLAAVIGLIAFRVPHAPTRRRRRHGH